MAKRKNSNNDATTANLGFEAKLWVSADAIQPQYHPIGRLAERCRQAGTLHTHVRKPSFNKCPPQPFDFF